MDLRTYRKDCLLGTLGALLMLVGNLCLTEGMAAFMPVYKLLGGIHLLSETSPTRSSYWRSDMKYFEVGTEFPGRRGKARDMIFQRQEALL